MPSAAFTLNGAASPCTTASAGGVVALALLSTSGVGTVEWTILGGSDSSKTKPTITAAGSPPGATAQFIMNSDVDGSIGLSWVVQCKINAGIDANGAPVPAYTATGIVGVLNPLGIIPFAAFESFERNAIVGIANDLNRAMKQAAAGQTSATYSNTLTIGATTTTLLQQIPLADNTKYRIYVYISARDTGNNEAEWSSFTSWKRAGGGNASQLGSDYGPAPVSEISNATLSGNWVTVAASTSNVNVSLITSNSSHIKVTYRIYVVSDTLTAAT